MEESIKRLASAIDKKNMKIAFGLEAQGHIPTIDKMLDGTNDWDTIAKEIGWVTETAMRCYILYLREQIKSLTSALDLAVGALEECRTTLSHACVFIASRQKMYKDGIEWHNKCEDKVKEALTAIAQIRKEG